MEGAKRKQDQLSQEADLRNVARKLFHQQSASTSSRPSISGAETKPTGATFRKPPVPTFHTRTVMTRSSSLQPLRNVTNTGKLPGARVPSKPVRGISFSKPTGRPGAATRPGDRNRAGGITSLPPETMKHIRQAEVALAAKQAVELQVETLRAQLEEASQLQAATQERHRTEVQGLHISLTSKEAVLKELQETLAARDVTITELATQLQGRERRVQELEGLVAEGDRMRKKLHNTLQELKGNIRVIARVRGNSSDASSYSFPDAVDHRAIELVGPATTNYAGDEKSKNFAFSFDRVFEPGTKQEEVFEEISQVVQSALDGYKVTIFAYGQTGSGKTFTMEGPTSPTPETAGMIPRAVEQIFAEGERLKPRGWEFQLQATFVEIYLEEVRDLLGDTAGYEKRAGVSSSGVTTYERASPKHEIHHSADGTTTISNVTTVPVTQPGDVLRLLQTAARHRSTASTKMNERSSRSHSVFTLRITGINKGTSQQSCGVLNLIDLAGSERLNTSGAIGDRLKETQNINRSLASLGDVIAALAAKKGHVPYRNSKLTYLLQNCLGGDGKTLMFVNISPEAQHVQESICSLRFAAKVNACEIGTAKRKVQ
eukprot:GGOE01054168.1.p1 GENE.GGOE01054168.1~~GGOE01054168.1.p1  ORF type:complete len:601 (-),score=200.02 GGOE01054168.1:484-2286(-)